MVKMKSRQKNATVVVNAVAAVNQHNKIGTLDAECARLCVIECNKSKLIAVTEKRKLHRSDQSVHNDVLSKNRVQGFFLLLQIIFVCFSLFFQMKAITLKTQKKRQR